MSNFGRRTWNRDEYAELAKEKKLDDGEKLKLSLSESQLDQLKKLYTNHDLLMKRNSTNLNQKILTSGVSSYKKGKQFGFYCDLCDMTFKDNLQYINHLNHKTHELRFEVVLGEPLIVDRRDNELITLEELESQYTSVIDNFVKDNGEPKIRPLKKKKKLNKTVQESSNVDPHMMTTMGFGSFGSSKR